MLNKLKNGWTYLICAVLGLFNFIFLAFPYISAYYSYDLGAWGGKQSESEGLSGYEVMSELWELEFAGVMSALMQILILVLGIGLLAFGVMGLLKMLGVFEKFPERLGNLETKKLGEFGLYGLAGLNLLLLVFLIIVAASNSEKSEYGSAGIRLSAGIFITLIFLIGAIVGLKLLEKKLPAGDGDGESYLCSKCGKRAKASDKFCNECGGAIEKRAAEKAEYACTKCGKAATEKDKFCSDCGGEIAVKAPPAPEAAEAPPPAAEDTESGEAPREA